MVPYDKPMEMLDMINRFIGVSDGTVKGMPTWIGEHNNEDANIPPASPGETSPPAEHAGDEEDTTGEKEDPWSEYYNW
jgi:carboxypeptidase D